MNPDFVHLRVHSEFSLNDSLIRLPELVATTAARGMPAVAVTDQGNMFGVVKFYQAALAAGIKPIIGADVMVANSSARGGYAPLALLCRNELGYLHLKRLVTRSYIEGRRNGVPVVDEAWLGGGAAEGLIALSAGPTGTIGQLLLENKLDDAAVLLRDYRALFADDFYLELQRTGRATEDDYIERAVALAAGSDCPLVATNDVRFSDADEFEIHEARTCIQASYRLDDSRRPRLYSEQQYLRTPEEMQQLFGELPEALENTVAIAKRCSVSLELGTSVLPDYEVPEGETMASHLANNAAAGLAIKLAGCDLDDGQRKNYDQRLERELEVITNMDFPGYFLIVADFIRWAKENGVPVGPGRGSGAGSLVAWVIGITDLDPLAFDLLFERFLNPERVSMPDFDIDFCMEGRDRVIDYVARRYGRERVSQIITFGSMGAKAVIRDVGRVMGQPYLFADRIARLIPATPGMTLADAFKEEPELGELYESDEDVRALIDMARPLEGLSKSAGTHAGGVVISPSVLTDFAPLYQADDEAGAVTQFDMKDIESVGLVKFDFLGLRTLTIIEWALVIINDERVKADKPLIKIADIPMDDPATFSLLQSSKTHAVFQLESSGMRDLIKRLQPDCFDDIVALVALFRPGPLQSGMVDAFIERKRAGDDIAIDYFHPSLEPVLTNTYGVILYQEQVMQVAQTLGGYSLGQADILRRAMGKKNSVEMAKQRDTFVAGAIANGVAEKLADRIFGIMEKFAEYGFNKSHSAAYALIAYQTAWLKAQCPEAFMAAVFSADIDYTDKLALHHRECKAMGIDLMRPDVNCSNTRFTVAGKGVIRYGLGALKGLGNFAADAICAERDSGGPFIDLHGFCRRVDGQKVNKRAMEALVKSGALDDLGANRPSLLAELPVAVGSAEQYARAEAAGQDDMFGTEPPPPPPSKLTVLPRWSPRKLFMNEYESLGLFLSGHPCEQYRHDVGYICTGTIAGVISSMPRPEAGEQPWKGGKEVTLAGLITDIRKRGNRVSMYLDDGNERVEIWLFSESFQAYKHLLEERSIRVVSGKLRYDDFIGGWRLAAKEVKDIDRVIEQRATGLVIQWLSNESGNIRTGELRELLEPHRSGRCDVSLVYSTGEAEARFVLGAEWRIRPSAELRDKLAEAVGTSAFRFDYQEHRVS